MTDRRRAAGAAGIALATLLLAGACSNQQPKQSEAVSCFGDTNASPSTSKDLPLAPKSARVDLKRPSFSNPTKVDNPLNPIAQLDQVLMLGNIEEGALTVEVTLLPETKMIECDGQRIEALVSQYVAYLDGRIHEVALDWYAQSDDGDVWYFGEDVFNYEDGVVADTEGTWLAGRDGPAGMIMPGDPKVGDVYRPENIPGLVFEEVTVKSIGQTVDGPRGAVEDAIFVSELHDDGTTEEKTFAPGYGEMMVKTPTELEAVGLAVPIDALSGFPPAELNTLASTANEIFTSAETGDWNAAKSAVDAMTSAWNTYASAHVPPMLAARMTGALQSVTESVGAQNAADSRQAALDAGRATQDLRMRHLPVAKIDIERMKLRTNQLLLDVAEEDAGDVAGDVTTLEWAWDRVAHTVDTAASSPISSWLKDLRRAADDEDLSVADERARQLLKFLEEIHPS